MSASDFPLAVEAETRIAFQIAVGKHTAELRADGETWWLTSPRGSKRFVCQARVPWTTALARALEALDDEAFAMHGMLLP